jgi:aspartyl-tRNA(Asn)/glutamyl-tRNA(Gln) amidotransferase subunit A
VSDLTQCTATELLALYAVGSASPVEATRAVLERIEALNPTLNAFAHLAPDEAMEAADASERRWHRKEPLGPLDGVPTTIKDLILTRGWPTRRGSRTVDPDQPWGRRCTARPAARGGRGAARQTTTPEFGCKARRTPS